MGGWGRPSAHALDSLGERLAASLENAFRMHFHGGGVSALFSSPPTVLVCLKMGVPSTPSWSWVWGPALVAGALAVSAPISSTGENQPPDAHKPSPPQIRQSGSPWVFRRFPGTRSVCVSSLLNPQASGKGWEVRDKQKGPVQSRAGERGGHLPRTAGPQTARVLPSLPQAGVPATCGCINWQPT